MNFRYETKPQLEGCVVVVEGEIDLQSSPVLREVLHREIPQHDGKVALDLKGVHYLDSTGLGVLIGATRRCRELGGDLVLRNVRPMMVRVIRLVKLDQVFTVEPLADAA